MIRRLALTLALLLVAAAPASAYQHLSQHAAVSGVQPDHWAALPINLTLDGGPVDLKAEIDTAVATWNAVPTAKEPFGTVTRAAADFDETNLGSAWGNLTGDGQREVVVDETGRAITALGFAPAAVNGFGPRHEIVNGGQALIDDMFLIVNDTRSDFDRQATEIHELGHTIGIAHSSVGFTVGKDGALSPELDTQVPTMDPFSAPGTVRRTLEADDVAAISDLYPEPTFASTGGTITGTVTRCDSGLPVLGANVRAVNVNDPSVQLTRVTGFDGGPEGTYTIHGVPPGDYFVVVEPLAGDTEFLDRLAMYTPVETGFTQEYFNATESDCAQDGDPSARDAVPVAAGGSQTADLKVGGVQLALVVDVTASMGPEIGAVKTGLETMIHALDLAPGDFPDTALVTFKDSANVDLVSRDAQALVDRIAQLTTAHTPDCPEGSNAALMTAGRLLAAQGRAVLVTDADALRHGPSRADVDELHASKGAEVNTLLSGSCPPEQNPPLARRLAADLVTDGAEPDEARPLDELGVENSIRTFSEESLFSGGVFSFQPGVKSGDATVQTGGELADENVPGPLLVVAPTPALPRLTNASPGSAARGATVDVTLTGANTAFEEGTSLASVSGAGVQVLSTHVNGPTSAVARLRIAGDAPLGFRDVKVTTDAQDAALLDGFEVRPAPAATPTPGSTPTPSPHGGGSPTTCSDRAPPRATLAKVAATRRRLKLHGGASDAGCVADISVAGRVALVEVAISRAAARRRCRFVAASGRLAAPRRCSRPLWLKARGTTRWSFAAKRALPPGTYTIQARARDAAGNRQARPARRTLTLRRRTR